MQPADQTGAEGAREPGTRQFPTRVFSGIQPTGELTLGNYLGAVKRWVELQELHSDCTWCVVDYHAITAGHEPERLRARTHEMVRDLLACGIDPVRGAIFVQSQSPEHLELAWIFAAVTAYGELQRMTQFKEKGDRQPFVSVGLFAYPVLQAADILAHKATLVPVGDDQLQHLELTREIAHRFNQRFGETFPLTEAVIGQSARVMSPADPERKMSKSLGDKHYIGVFEDEASIRRKIKGHVTDTGATKRENGEIPPGVANLLMLLEASGAADAAQAFRDEERSGKLMYRDLKEAVADGLVEMLKPIQSRRLTLDDSQVRDVLADGGARARRTARATLEEARAHLGLLETPIW